MQKTEQQTQRGRSRLSSIPDSSLKEVKLMSIWTLTSPQPLTSSLKSSAVRSSRAFLGSTSSKPFLIAYQRHVRIGVNTNFCAWQEWQTLRWSLVERWISEYSQPIRGSHIFLSVLLTWRGCSATTSILCSAYFLTYSYTLRGVTGMLTPPDRSSTWPRMSKASTSCCLWNLHISSTDFVECD